MLCASDSDVRRGRSVEDVQEVVREASATGKSLIARGSGFSYGDPSLNAGNIVVGLRPMNRILSWDPGTGVVDLEPGVTIGDLCAHVLRDGWWPPVVPGTRYPTIGGCVAANAHGKNNWKAGPIGEHVEEVEVVTADGERQIWTPKSHPDLFRAFLGGFGMLGVAVRIRLRMRRSTGLLRVEQYAAPRLADVMAILDRWTDRADHMVGWIDAFAGGEELGRGLVQIADEVGEQPPRQPSGLNGLDRLKPVSSGLWLLMKPVANQKGMRAVNAAQYNVGSLMSGKVRLRPEERFEFFHDTVPGWNRAFSPGIIQYQMFVPKDQAHDVFQGVLGLAQEVHAPFLAVLKRHRADAFLLSSGVDGYSLSLDFHVTHRIYRRLTEVLKRATDEIVLPAGGRFYLAKDSVLTPLQLGASFGAENVDTFLELKRRVDPKTLFQSDMYRRLFGG